MCLILFLTGLLVDALWVACVTATAKRKPTLAALASMALAVVQMTLTVVVFESPAARSALGIGAFALGSALGSYWIVRRS